jgi:hypothetical protein
MKQEGINESTAGASGGNNVQVIIRVRPHSDSYQQT